MRYQKQNFANGNVLTAENLNHMENGISDVESTSNATKAVVDEIIDPTLSLSGKAADAAKVGEAVNAEATRAKAAEKANENGISAEAYFVVISQRYDSTKVVAYKEFQNGPLGISTNCYAEVCIPCI